VAASRGAIAVAAATPAADRAVATAVSRAPVAAAHRRGHPARAAAQAAAAVVVAVAAVVDSLNQTRSPEMKITKTLLASTLAALLVSASVEARAQSPAAPAANKPAAAKPAAAKQKSFASPKEAAAALAAAVRAANVDELLAVVGPDSRSWIFSGDNVADRADWKRFLDAYDQKNALQTTGDKAVLEVGNDAWPFPAPIVKKGAEWTFDANAGREEVLNRRVGRNELNAIQTLLAAVDAQREYAASDPDRNGFADYARRFNSTPGKKDGLYWPTKAGEPESPLGPLVAVAAREGYGKSADKPAPFHGYHYRLLTSQGKNAPGGAYDYVVGGKLLGGFGIVAYPATYGVSGVMTFVVNHEGVVREKDLGAQTASVAGAMTRFDPDATWKKAQ